MDANGARPAGERCAGESSSAGWLLGAQKPMLNEFLDALEIPHADDGTVDELPACSAEGKNRGGGRRNCSPNIPRKRWRFICTRSATWTARCNGRRWTKCSEAETQLAVERIDASGRTQEVQQRFAHAGAAITLRDVAVAFRTASFTASIAFAGQAGNFAKRPSSIETSLK